MAISGTLNVRLPDELKERGMQVLARNGVSVSDAVRTLFCELEQTQQVPEFILSRCDSSSAGKIETRRNMMRSMVGVLPADIDVDCMKSERLTKKCAPGVRE